MSIIIASLQNPGRISWQRANNETDTELRWHGGECLWQVQGRNPSPSWQRTWTQAISVPFRGISQKYPQEYKGFRQNIDREKILLKPKLFQRAIYYRPGGKSGQIWPKKSTGMQKKTQTVENIHQNHIERYFSALPQSSFDAVASPSTVEGSQRPILQETSLGVWRHWMLPRLYKSRILCRSRRITVALSSHQSHFSWQSTDKWPSTLATSNLSKTHVIWDIDGTSIKTSNSSYIISCFSSCYFNVLSLIQIP